MLIIPVIIATPPAGLRRGNTERYFGATEAEASETENIERGNVVSMYVKNWLPPPDRGSFQVDFDGNCAKLIDIVRRELSKAEAAASGGGASSGGGLMDLDRARGVFAKAMRLDELLRTRQEVCR
jgi:hypothetical protein